MYLDLHERPHRLDAFLAIRHLLGARVYWHLVREVWMDTENVYQRLPAWIEVWSHEPRHEAVMDDVERDLLAELPDDVAIYRGVQHRSSRRSLSWTLDQTVATQFAGRRRRAAPLLLECRIRRTQILALLNQRKEMEIVVDPASLSSLDIIEHPLD